MDSQLINLPLEHKIKLVEDLWDSIAAEQDSVKLTSNQKEELEKRLNAYESSGDPGCLASEVVNSIREKL